MRQIFGSGLGSLAFLQEGQSRAVNCENPTGEKGGGGTACGMLGPSRKGSPFIRELASGETKVLAKLEGAGMIRHIWMTVTDRTEAGFFVLSDLVLRMYWDGEETPSVECPLGDFFCNGFGTGCNVNSLPIAVNPVRGFNCFFPMPFRKGALITIENQHSAAVPRFFYQIDYTVHDTLPEDTAYFHAQWRRERLTGLKRDYTVLDGVRGRGHYVGTYLALTSLERYWWGEGEVKFYLDGDELYPTICGTGLEDYFGGAWGFTANRDVNGSGHEELYQTPFMGYHFYSDRDETFGWRFEGACPPMRGLYRFHIMDAVRFEKDLKVTIQQIGMGPEGLFERQDDYASVAYWYQSEPHGEFPVLASAQYRRPR